MGSGDARSGVAASPFRVNLLEGSLDYNVMGALVHGICGCGKRVLKQKNE